MIVNNKNYQTFAKKEEMCYNDFIEDEISDINSGRNLRYILRMRYVPSGRE